MSSFEYLLLAVGILFFLILVVKVIIERVQSTKEFQSQMRSPFSSIEGSSYETRVPQTPIIGILNPNKCAVCVRILSEDGDTNELLSIEKNGSGYASVGSGQYYIRYKFNDNKQVYEGEHFRVEYGSTAMITLKYTPGGNYRSWPVDEPL